MKPYRTVVRPIECAGGDGSYAKCSLHALTIHSPIESNFNGLVEKHLLSRFGSVL